jgi:hypothetical protein
MTRRRLWARKSAGNYAPEYARSRDGGSAVAMDDPPMPPFTTRQLKRQLEQFGASTSEDRDEMLNQMLVAAYPSKRAQDN